MDDKEQAAIDALRAAGLAAEAIAIEALRASHRTTLAAFEKAQRHAYTEGRKDPVLTADDVAEAMRKRFVKLQRFSFHLDDAGNVRRVKDYCGNWVEFQPAHELFDPVMVDAALKAAASAVTPFGDIAAAIAEWLEGQGQPGYAMEIRSRNWPNR